MRGLVWRLLATRAGLAGAVGGWREAARLTDEKKQVVMSVKGEHMAACALLNTKLKAHGNTDRSAEERGHSKEKGEVAK